MINQIKIDLGDQVAGLAAARLCLDENSPSVKQQAETIGVTRARVYQLLEDCAKVMDVRWPEGRWLLRPAGHPLRHVRSGNDRPGARHRRPVLSAGKVNGPGGGGQRRRAGHA